MDRIIINGFPRSGNTYLKNIFSDSFINVSVIMDHSVSKLTEKKCFVPIRKPSITIPNYLEFYNHQKFIGGYEKITIESIISWYERFYLNILKNVNNITILDFNDIAINTNKILSYVKNKYNYNMVDINILNIDKNKSINVYETLEDNDNRIKICNELYNEVLKKKLII